MVALGGPQPLYVHSPQLASVPLQCDPRLRRLALDACKSESGMELLLLSPGGPKDSESSGLALAQLARLPSLSSAIQPVSLATWPQPLLQWQLCWAQGFEPDFGKDGSRHLG